MFRIVRASNFDEEWFNEEFILWSMEEEACRTIVDVLNESSDSHANWYKTVDEDYKLHIGIEV